MYNHNSLILLKCFSKQLPYINGVYAIQKEIENKNLISTNTITNTEINHSVNYFNIIPYEIILLIIDKLPYDHSIINFCIAIHKCDKITLSKLVCLYDIYCWQCESIKLKYYNCYYCNKKLCLDCIKKCASCDNVIKGDKSKNINNLHYCIKDSDSNLHNEPCSCAENMRKFPWLNKQNTVLITNTQYHTDFDCIDCELNVCYDCITEVDAWSWYCPDCMLNN